MAGDSGAGRDLLSMPMRPCLSTPPPGIGVAPPAPRVTLLLSNLAMTYPSFVGSWLALFEEVLCINVFSLGALEVVKIIFGATVKQFYETYGLELKSRC